jgi:rare lipoprotein A
LAILSGLAALSACAGAPDRGIQTASGAGTVKIGKPYRINGRLYTPRDERNYRETGTASWYGPNFHGKPTANGERFDQNGISAAHRTLPLPSFVLVENLDNGRQLTVRVNDRGPFAHNRIIDLSRRAAQLLDMQRAGVARVRVTRIYPDGEDQPGPKPLPRVTIAAAPQAKVRSAPVRTAAAPVPVPVPVPAAPPALPERILLAQSEMGPDGPIPSTLPDTRKTIRSVDVPQPGEAPQTDDPADWLDGGVDTAAESAPPAEEQGVAAGRMIQVAALSQSSSVVRLSAALGNIPGLGPVSTEMTASGLIRVRVGPFVTAEEAESMLAKLKAAGYDEARLVGDPVS